MLSVRRALSWLVAGVCVCAAQSPLQTYFDQGDKASHDREFVKAQAAFQTGLQAAEAAHELGWAAKFEQSLGDLLVNQRQFKEAEPHFQRALERFEATEDRGSVNGVRFRLGKLYASLSALQKAVPYLELAQKGFLEGKDAASAASVLDILGQVQARLNRFPEATAALKESLAISESLNDGQRIAKVRGSLADLYSRHSDFGSALEQGFLALEGNEKFGQTNETAKVLDVLGNTYHKMGQTENALRYYRRALELRQANHLDLSFSYKNLGAVLKDSGRYAEALDYSKRSLELAKKDGIAREIAGNLNNIAGIEEELGKGAEARKELEEALAIAESAKLPGEQSMALYKLGNLAMTAHDYDRALELHERALKVRESAGETRDVVWSLNRLALVNEARGDLEGAEQAHKRALELFENIGAGIADPTEYGAYRQTSVVLYPYYSRVLVKLGKAREALSISERGRAVGLSRLARLDAASFTEHLSPKDAEAWSASEAALGRASNQLRVALERTSPDRRERDIEVARALYFEKDQEFSNLRDRIFASTPALRSSASDLPANVDQLIELVKNSPGTMLLEYLMVSRGSSIVFAVTSGGVEAILLDAGSEEIGAVSRPWLTGMARDHARGITVKPTVPSESREPELARKLYELVFARLEPWLSRNEFHRLVLGADGPLLEIPFAALMDERGRRLLDRYAISNTVSLGYLLMTASRKRATKSLLAVGDPLSPGEQRMVAPSGDLYGALRSAAAESKAVSGLFEGSVTLSGPAAREAEVKRALPQYKILHFATHGVLDTHDGLRSGLLLATEPAESAEDGLLQAREIANMSLRAELAVLSACETGRGDERLGDGLLGLAWAFQAAGVPRVIASLWSVDDAGTRDLMIALYKELTKGAAVDDALRTAALHLQKDSRYADPYFWAAFELMGKTSPLP